MTHLDKKGMDLAAQVKTVHEAASELAEFMKVHVKPLLSKSDSEIEEALREVKAPKTGKGLKHVLKFIADQASFIANSSR